MSPWLCAILRSMGINIAACAPPAPVPPPKPAPVAGFLYLVNTGNSILTMRAGGTSRTTLVTNGITPSFTPDGRIIFVGLDGPTPQIEIMDATGANRHQVGIIPWSGVTGGPIMPQLARNGLIVFQKQAPTFTEIWGMNSDGSNLKLIVRSALNPTQPSLAPSGTWLTYTAQTTINGAVHREIHRVNTDGTGDVALTFPGDPNYPDANASSISTDETKVAFFSGLEQLEAGTDPATWGNRNIAYVPANGGGATRVLVTGCVPIKAGQGPCVAADNPFWLPDGRIGYDRDDGNTWASALPSGGQIATPTQILPMSRGPVRVPVQ